MSFVEDYKNILKNRYKKVICRYNAISGKYDYIPFYHEPSNNWDANFVDLLIKNLLNYCYYSDEMERLYNPNFPKLEIYIAKSIKDRLNQKTNNEQQDGLCGELLLDLILRMENENNETLLCRPKYQQKGAKAELKNYDALFFKFENNNITLILGQVKSGKYDYCTEKIEDDLNTKYNNHYFGDALCYIADKRLTDNMNSTLTSVLSEFNNIALGTEDNEIRHNKICEYIKTNKIFIEIPCLLIYTNEKIYENIDNLKQKLDIEVNKIKDYFEQKLFDISDFDFQISFYIFPAKNVSTLRKSIMDYKRKVIYG